MQNGLLGVVVLKSLDLVDSQVTGFHPNNDLYFM